VNLRASIPIALCTLFAWSCSDRVIVPVVDTVKVHRDAPHIDPSTLTLNAGDQLTLTVSSLPGDVWRWSSSNTNVVTVEQTGLIHGIATGNATVTARLTSDTTVFASAAVFVSSPISCQALSIVSINSAATGAPADLAALAGAIDVHFSLLTAPSGTAMLVIRRASGDTTVASIPGPSSTPDCSAVLRWDTAARAPAGNPLFPNGTYALFVRFITSSGTTISSTTQQASVANP
jgi:hypothetical protein